MKTLIIKRLSISDDQPKRIGIFKNNRLICTIYCDSLLEFTSNYNFCPTELKQITFFSENFNLIFNNIGETA